MATKELSQDAFIAWLLQFADDRFQSSDPELNKCGKTFITNLIKKQVPIFDGPINEVRAGRQWKNIDVWAEVNDKYLIIIEDKTYTFSHSNQLARYKEISEKWCAGKNYQKPICIYLKTGNESKKSLDQVIQQGFSIYSRIDLVNLLSQFTDINNDIFRDFYERLVRIEKSYYEFEDKPIKDWSSNDWQGFFMFLEKEISIKDWNYVNNQSGGFWNAVLNWDYWGDYPTYLQLEEGKLCFKISTHPSEKIKIPENSTRADIRDEFHAHVISNAQKMAYKHIKRPSRFGNGNYMTVAVVDRPNWLGADNETIDKKTVIGTLTDYLKFLRDTIQQ